MFSGIISAPLIFEVFDSANEKLSTLTITNEDLKELLFLCDSIDANKTNSFSY